MMALSVGTFSAILENPIGFEQPFLSQGPMNGFFVFHVNRAFMCPFVFVVYIFHSKAGTL